MEFSLPTLPYEVNDLQPAIDPRTLTVHYNQIHADRLDRLNALIRACPDLAQRSLEEIIADIRQVPQDLRQAVRNAAGGHLNHSLYWRIMKPYGDKQSPPKGLLAKAVESDFGDLAGLRASFLQTASRRFGSGWVWVVLDEHDDLQIVTTPNDDSPIMMGYQPILGADLWEHAYYLTYPDRRQAYLQAWWEVINWPEVEHNYRYRRELSDNTRRGRNPQP
jgi:Fe-Mn family superoxide dismutase